MVRHLELEVAGSITARKISVNEHTFSSVICRDDNYTFIKQSYVLLDHFFCVFIYLLQFHLVNGVVGI